MSPERKKALGVLYDYDVNFDGHSADEIVEAFDVAFKLLEQEPCEDATLKDIFCMGCEYKEQEPCEDAISRAEAIKIVDNMLMGERNHKIKALEELEQLPSVQPKPKTGYWIENEDEMEVCCSECGEENDRCSKCCPNCGVRMTESKNKE